VPGRHRQINLVNRDQVTEAPGQAARADRDVAAAPAHRPDLAHSTLTGSPAGKFAASVPSETSAR